MAQTPSTDDQRKKGAASASKGAGKTKASLEEPWSCSTCGESGTGVPARFCGPESDELHKLK